MICYLCSLTFKLYSMSTFERETREHLENLAFDKAELHDKHLKEIEEQEEIDECEDMLIAYMGSDSFNNLSKDDLSMIIDAMKEYADKKVSHIDTQKY